MAVFREANESAILKSGMATAERDSPVGEGVAVDFEAVESPWEGLKPACGACERFLEKEFLSLEVVWAEEETFVPVE
ncbi:MAG UNVERIFIED_CONTAM: hypothetical protein LVR18_16685 [Planctomycetaceae bacterium]|jgi:hypothetical protein